MSTHRLNLSGHLTEEALNRSLTPVSAAIRESAQSVALIIDVRSMSGYDTAARDLFISWNRAHKKSIRRVAILTENLGWRAVIAAMSLASGQKMRAFRTAEEAGPWLG